MTRAADVRPVRPRDGVLRGSTAPPLKTSAGWTAFSLSDLAEGPWQRRTPREKLREKSLADSSRDDLYTLLRVENSMK